MEAENERKGIKESMQNENVTRLLVLYHKNKMFGICSRIFLDSGTFGEKIGQSKLRSNVRRELRQK